jgi:hypothetical protein
MINFIQESVILAYKLSLWRLSMVNFWHPDELAEDLIRNNRRIINTDNKIIVSVSPKQAAWLEGLYRHSKFIKRPDEYTADGHYIDNKNRVFTWHLQGKDNSCQIVAIYRYDLKDYQSGKAEEVDPRNPQKKKFTKIDEVKKQTILPFEDM